MMYPIEIGGYVRVDKREARNLYNRGETVRIVPRKLSAVNPSRCYIDANNRNLCEIGNVGFSTVVARNRDFDTVVMCFEYYRCCTEIGSYAAYYIRKGAQL